MSNVTRKEESRLLNLGLDVTVLAMAQERTGDKEVSTHMDSFHAETSIATQPKVHPTTTLFDARRLALTRNGRILRFSLLFSGTPAHGRGRFRPRKLRIRKKKIDRLISFAEDTMEIHRKNILPQQKREQLPTSILTHVNDQVSSLKKNSSHRMRQLEEIFESRAPGPDHLLPHAQVLHKASSMNHHPVELLEWEEKIKLDVPERIGATIASSYLYAGSYISQSPSGSASRSTSISRPTTPTHLFHPRPMAPPIISSSRPTSPSILMPPPKSLSGRITNHLFACADWENQIIWDDRLLPDSLPPTQIQINMNDPLLILETIDMTTLTEKLIKTEKLIHKRLKKLRFGTTSDGKSMVVIKFDKPVADRFNISNDKQYETSKDTSGLANNTGKLSSSNRLMVSSRIGVHHSVPALKLAMPYYKTFWTKNELRAWHRPKLDLTSVINCPLSFNKLAKSKDGSIRKSTAAAVSNSKKLSLREKSSDFILLEYSEEFPLLMMNVGMATFLLNYYRKQQVKETPVIEKSFGVPRILEPTESSPFWIFGDVRPGETLTAAQNNLFRAPLFEHVSNNRDFLGLRFNVKGQVTSKWYIRELPPYSLTVGQIFPTMEVFGPHSRKHNIYCRGRIQAFAYRLFRKDSEALGNENMPRLKIGRIMAAFPQFSEGSLRKWLKEYADSVRSGHDSGTWRQRNDAPNLNEDDIRALVTPEMVCQYESMLAGQQRLNDAGFMDLPEVEVEEQETMDDETAEIKLSPWNLSANFINAIAGKCSLQLHGLGDPSGRGEAFSFAKSVSRPPIVTLKSAGSADTSFQDPQPGGTKMSKFSSEQVVYRQEIVKTWDAQLKALRSSHLIEEDSSDGLDDSASVGSRSTSRNLDKKLVIRRVYDDPTTGVSTEETETITDQRLISAYINQRRVWERKRRRREIAAAASAARAKKARPEGAGTLDKKVSVAGSKQRKAVQVRCGTCGEIGHMRTNRICPKFSEYEAELKRAEGDSRSQSIEKLEPVKISISKYIVESATNAPVPPIKFKLPAQSIIPRLSYEQKRALEDFSGCLDEILNTIMSDPESWPFNKPVKKSEYPVYYQIIDNPLDFGTIKNRVKKYEYTSVDSFLNDIKLVRNNCFTFNGPDHPFSISISRLVDLTEGRLQDPRLADLCDRISNSKSGSGVGGGENRGSGDSSVNDSRHPDDEVDNVIVDN